MKKVIGYKYKAKKQDMQIYIIIFTPFPPALPV